MADNNDITEIPTNQNDEKNEFDDLAAWDGDKIAEILNADGPTVKAVLLKTDGTAIEVDYDSTPKQNKVTEILGSPPSIIGQYPDLDVIVVGCRWDTEADKEALGVNTHKLRYPFNNDSFYGNIFLYKFSQDCIVQDFTLKEYTEFASKLDEDTDKVWELPTACDTANAFDNDGQGDNDDAGDEEEDFDPEAMAEYFREIARNKVKKDFPIKFGRDPTEEELEQFADASMQAMMGMFGGMPMDEDLDEDDDDEEYNPEDDANQELLDMEEDAVHEEAVQKELENDEQNDALDDVTEAVSALTIVDDDIKEENINPENGEELTSEQFEEEYKSAMDIARMLGKKDSKCLINSICDTYNEINGKEPDLDALHGIIGRVFCQFAEENDSSAKEADECDDEKNESEKVQQEESVNVKVLTTPVKKQGKCSRVDIYFENTKATSLETAASNFEKINKKAPNDDDTKRLKEFLKTGMLFEDVVATKPLAFGLNKNGDDDADDSDYDPKKDTFDYSKDVKDEDDFQSMLLNKENSLDAANNVDVVV